MPIRVKVASTGSSTDWRSIKKLWVKRTSSSWSSATALYAKVASGWAKMWPGDAPAVDLSDPIDLRLGGYSGTRATSPQLFASSDTGGTFLKLWGNDGSYTGVTPITLSARRILCSDNIDGQVARFSLSGNDTIDFGTTTQATRDLAEGYYLFYQLLAENADGQLDAYSPPIKVIKRRPAIVSSVLLLETGGTLSGQSGLSANHVISLSAEIRWGWWIRPGDYLGGTPVLKWWKNTSRSPGGTLLKEINITSGYNYVSGSSDSSYAYSYNSSTNPTLLTIGSNYNVGNAPLQIGEYIIAELYLENSYTAHHNAPVSFWGSTGTSTISNPTSLVATTSRTDGVSLTFSGSVGATSYDIYWNTTASGGPLSTTTPDFLEKTSPYLDTSIPRGNTRYYWVRGKNSSGVSDWFPVGNGVMGTRFLGTAIMPYVIGETESAAALLINQAGLAYEYTYYTTVGATAANHGRVESSDPVSGTELPANSNTSLTLYNYIAPIIPTISMGGNSSITQTSGQINWFSTNQASFSSNGTFSASGTTQNFVAKTGLTAGTSYTGTVTVTSSTGNSASAPYNIGTSGATFTMPNLIGLTAAQAGDAITAAGFYYENSYETVTNNSSLNQIVFAQTPEAGFVGIPQNAYFDYYVYQAPNTITYGDCTAYGSSIALSEGYVCSGNYSYYYTDNTYYQRRQVLVNGTWNNTYNYDCSNTTVRTYGGLVQVNGQCGYTTPPPPPVVCVYTDYGAYHYSPGCHPSGTPRSGSLSGVTSGACCPTVYKTSRFVCNDYDVYNSASANYYDCYNVGQCAAQYNSSGSRSVCYI